MSTYDTWVAGVLNGIAAPVDAANLDTVWGWSGAESGTDRMRWNNPLNTTQPEGAGNVDANSVGVKIYPSVEQGIQATVTTLLNGYYPLIVSHLRNSVPRAQWGDACAELGTWGTGCGWLTANYGAAPQSLGEIDLTDQQALQLQMLYNNLIGKSLDNPDGRIAEIEMLYSDDVGGAEANPKGVAATVHRIEADLAALKAQVAGLTPTAPAPADLQPVLTAVNGVAVNVTATLDKITAVFK